MKEIKPIEDSADMGLREEIANRLPPEFRERVLTHLLAGSSYKYKGPIRRSGLARALRDNATLPTSIARDGLGVLGTEGLAVAVVGLGKMGLLHSCVLNVLPHVKLVALCEKSAMPRKLFKGVFDGVQIVDDVEKLVGLNLDAVYVTTPIPSHFPVAKAIYTGRVARNLFVEKTLASNYEEARELCELAHRFGGVDMVGYLRRFSVTFKKAKDLLSQSVLGEVSSFKAYAFSGDFVAGTGGLGMSASRGGVLRDLGCHAIDMGLWFFGELQVVSAELTSLPDSRSQDSFYFRVKNSLGLEGQFNISWCMDKYRMPDVGFSIIGSKGIMDVNDDKVELNLNNARSFTWYRHDLNDNVPFCLGLPEYYREDLHFTKSVMEGVSADPSFYSASKVDEIIDEAQKRAVKSG
jgi:predicted dehydrogenase